MPLKRKTKGRGMEDAGRRKRGGDVQHLWNVTVNY